MTIRAHVAPASGAAGGDALASTLKDHRKAAFLPHNYPREVVFHSALPKAGTGKIDRQALKGGG